MRVVGIRSIGAESENFRRIHKLKIYLNQTNTRGDDVMSHS